MFIAKNKGTGELVYIDEADAESEYICPVCEQPVIIKNGYVVASHFAHKTKTFCDTFSHDMSEWHKWWQAQFPKGNREHVEEFAISVGDYYRAAIKYHFLSKDVDEFCAEHSWDTVTTLKHRADVRANGYVIEFQNSPISMHEFNERNWFYQKIGCKVIWVFNLISDNQKENLSFRGYPWRGHGKHYEWKYKKTTFKTFFPQHYVKNLPVAEADNKSVVVFFQFTDYDATKTDAPLIEQVVWASPLKSHGVASNRFSDFSEFVTNKNVLSPHDLKNAIRNKEL